MERTDAGQSVERPTTSRASRPRSSSPEADEQSSVHTSALSVSPPCAATSARRT